MTRALSMGLVLVVGMATTNWVAAADPRIPFQIDDLYRHDAVTDLVAMPNGQQGVFVRDWAERGQLLRRNALWHVRLDADGHQIRRALEPGQPDARKPVLSPDGQWVAFLSTRPLADGAPAFSPVPVWSDPATDIWLIPAAGGKAIPLAGAKKPYGRVFSDPFYARVAFSPDGKRLAFVADDGADSQTQAERDANITIVRDDQGEGYEGFGAGAIWVADLVDLNQAADVAAKRVRRLTTDDAWYADPQWTPDGQSLVVTANRTRDRESARFSINKNFDLWRINIESAGIEQLTFGPGPQVSPRISPDGKRLVCLSVPRNGPHADVYNLELVSLTDTAGLRPTSRVLFDHHAVGAIDAPPHGWATFPLPTDCWLDDRSFVIDTVAGLKSQRQLIDANSPQGQVDARGPDANAVHQQRTAARSKLTPPSNEFLQERLLAEDQIVRWTSFDGLSVDGVLTVPPPSVAKPPFKLLLYPHGGPHSRSTPGFNFTTQIFAANGYAVFQPNFRGTSGYGKSFLDADRCDLGGGDMQDILTGIEHLAKTGVIDPQRQFVYGISYGGFMTTWLIGHTHQFRAAAPQNAVTHMDTMWGVGDLQSWSEWELGGRPWEVPDLYRKHSPFTYADKVRTPTLILHADHDRRCPLPMGKMFHRALKSAGVETEMVIYHNERHGIVQLPHQADIYRRVLEWFAKHDVKSP